jgi:hypothetical protein
MDPITLAVVLPAATPTAKAKGAAANTGTPTANSTIIAEFVPPIELNTAPATTKVVRATAANVSRNDSMRLHCHIHSSQCNFF